MHLAFELPVDYTSMKARTGLSGVGHQFPAVERVLVIKDESKKFVLVELNSTIDEETETAIHKKVKSQTAPAKKSCTDSVHYATTLYDTRKTNSEIKALLFFDRATFT